MADTSEVSHTDSKKRLDLLNKWIAKEVKKCVKYEKAIEIVQKRFKEISGEHRLTVGKLG